MTSKIRQGYEAADVNLWQQLCQAAKTESGESVRHLFMILDMAKHNDCDVLDIVKTGRVCSNSKIIDQKFADALIHCVDTPDPEWVTEMHHRIEEHERKPSTQVLDLTCEDESSVSSHSYEETSQEYNDNPTSNEAYKIDGFVVEDHHSSPAADEVDSLARFGGAASSSTSLKKSTLKFCETDADVKQPKKRTLKRRIEISQE